VGDEPRRRGLETAEAASRARMLWTGIFIAISNWSFRQFSVDRACSTMGVVAGCAALHPSGLGQVAWCIARALRRYHISWGPFSWKPLNERSRQTRQDGPLNPLAILLVLDTQENDPDPDNGQGKREDQRVLEDMIG